MAIALVPKSFARADSASAIRDAISDAVKQADPQSKYKGVTWSPWRNDTRFESDWLLPTPGVWGVGNPLPGWMSPGEPATCSGAGCNTSVMLPSCNPASPTACAATKTTCVASAATVLKPGGTPANVCMSPADRMVDEVYKAVAGATTSVDITSLALMDGRFLLGFKNALTYLANTHQPVTVRFLYGNIPTQATLASLQRTMTALIGGAMGVAGSQLTLYAGYLRSGTLAVTGWNHSKTIITDAAKILIGGENWISADYLGAGPVFDLNMKLHGQVAADATAFVNALWTDLCDHNNLSNRRNSQEYAAASAGVGKATLTDGCLKTLPAKVTAGGGSVYAMTAGRLGEIDYTNGAQGTAALVALMAAAKSDIRISNQDIQGPGSRWPDIYLNVIADQLIAGREVHIVQTSDDSGGSVSGYSNGTLTDLAEKLRSALKTRKNAPHTSKYVNALLCKSLYLAQVRFTTGVQRYPNNKGIANHAKTVAVDDSTFYIGSQNLYPPDRNMELGIIVSDPSLFAQWKSNYWDPTWTSSKQSAISGGSPSNCYFR